MKKTNEKILVSALAGMTALQGMSTTLMSVCAQENDEMNRHFTEESLKSVTPFEMGGYDMTQGNSWNNNDFGGMF